MTRQSFKNYHGDTATITKTDSGLAKLICRTYYGYEFLRETHETVSLAKERLSNLSGSWFTTRGWVQD